MKIDMHVHSKLGGDCSAEPHEIVEAARAKGLDAICITEHHSFLASEPFERIAEKEGFLVFRGAEYHSRDGHLLIFGVKDDRFNKGYYLPAQEIIDYVLSEGGIVIPAHPFKKGYRFTMGNKIFQLKGLVAIETLNGKTPPKQNFEAELARRKLGLFATGGSDAHTHYDVGKVYTVFRHEIRTIEDLVEVLRQGNYYPIQTTFNNALKKEIKSLKGLMNLLQNKGFSVKKQYSHPTFHFYEDKGLEVLIIGLTSQADEEKIATCLEEANEKNLISKRDMLIILRSHNDNICAFGVRAPEEENTHYESFVEESFDGSGMTYSPFLNVLERVGYKPSPNKSVVFPSSIEIHFRALPENVTWRFYKRIIYVGNEKRIRNALHVLEEFGIPYTYLTHKNH